MTTIARPISPISRRGLLRGLFAAPAIIAIDRLMPVRTPKLITPSWEEVKLLGSGGSMEAGLYYCPYVPLHIVRANGEIQLYVGGFQTRYATLEPVLGEFDPKTGVL